MRGRPEAAGPARSPTTPSTSRGSAHCSTTPGIRYELDPTLVRGLDYYTRTLFEFTSDALGAQSGVGGGGRYDGLIEQLGGQPTPGFGWAAGVERILLAAGELPIAAEPRRPVRRAVDGSPAPRAGGVRAGARGAPRGPRGAARARRPVAEGPAQARGPDRRALRCDRGRRTRSARLQGHGVAARARARDRRRDSRRSSAPDGSL